MYCGSCLRDNALAAELTRQGHDVTLLPFYTPTLTDEENVSRQEQIFFGGISVYLEQHMSWFRNSRLLDSLLVEALPTTRAAIGRLADSLTQALAAGMPSGR